jgi:hypothetical protein
MAISKKALVEKWEKVEGGLSIKGIKDRDVKENLAVMLENQESKDFSGELLKEENSGAINTGTLGGYSSNVADADSWKFRPIALALVRRTFPDLFANKIVGVQAMSTPVGLAYALRVVYGDGTGNEAAWDKVPYYGGYTGSTSGTSGTLKNGNALNSSASDGYADTSGTGAATSAAEAWSISAGCRPTQTLSITSGTGTLTTSYPQGCGAWPQLKMRIDQVAITAKTRKLAASFSLEAAQDVKAMQGLDIEREMVNFLQYEVTAELDRELLTAVKDAAVDTTNGGEIISAIDLTGWTGTTVAGIDGRWSGEKFMNVIASIIYQQNKIAIRTRRGPANFCVVSPGIATALQAAGHQFVQFTSNVNATHVMAPIGKLNGAMDVYRDQYAYTEYALAGFKGSSISDAGVIFSPYIMGLTMRAISPDDFAPRIGTMARYAITNTLLGAGRYYRLIPFYNVDKLIAGASLTN